MRILVADIGGTNCSFGIASGINADIRNIEHKESRGDYIVLIGEYLKKHKADSACIAAAGPVLGNKVRMVNSTWTIDADEIRRKTGLKKVTIINDFVAIGYGINVIRKKDIRTINPGKPLMHGIKAVIGAGTGLGKCFLTYDDKRKMYIPYPSEGGHADLPLDEDEHHLDQNLCYEDILSGRGIEVLYQFLAKTKYNSSQMPKAEEISATRNTNPCSKETFKWFTKFYARCARNFALEVLPYSGIYIAGGIAIKNQDIFDTNFMKEFTRHKALGNLLKRIPIYLIKNPDVSLKGAAVAFTLS